MSVERSHVAISQVVSALRFNNRSPGGLREIGASGWPRLFRLTDRMHLTLLLAVQYADVISDAAAASRLRRNLDDNRTRYNIIRAVCAQIADAFQAAGVPFIFLKGLSNWPYYVTAPEHRPQYDIDLFTPPLHLAEGHRALRDLGFVSYQNRPSLATDHLPTMIRKTGWRWRGDYFDPDMPPSVELHFRLWNSETEQIAIAGTEEFWNRRVSRAVNGLAIPTLSPADGISYCALHLLRHLLRGDVRPYHVYELGHLLETSAADDELWDTWLACTPIKSRILQAIAFRLSVAWFRCSCHPAAMDAMSLLSADVERWFRLFAFSPLLCFERPNKDELLLHMLLINGRESRTSVLLRRLIPRAAAPVVEDPHSTDTKSTICRRVRRRVRLLAFAVSRARYHTSALASLVRSCIRWSAERHVLARLTDGCRQNPKADREHTPVGKQVSG